MSYPIPQMNQEFYAPDRLVAGDLKLVTDTGICSTGQVLARGALVGIVTASGEYILSLPGATDGSQNPCGVVAKAVDATAAATNTVIYQTGEFDDSVVIFGAGHTAASTKVALAAKGIFLKTSVKA